MTQDTSGVLHLAGADMRLVRVPEGEFVMGSPFSDEDAGGDESPPHKVYLSEYCIGKYPVTVAQWRAFVQASGYVGDSRALRQGKDDHPVNYVSWNDAAAFCVWASEVSGRAVALPSEAQWEKAARGPDGRGYPWGNEPAAARRCNCDRSEGDTTPVGRYSPSGDSPYGCADMSGNVWEWVADWHCFDYYAVSPRSDPQGPSSGRQRAMRGGCWWSFPTDTCAARRSSCGEAGRSEFYGFRIRMASQ